MDARIYPSLPLLNFLALLLLAVTRGTPDLFRQLASHSASHIKEMGSWDEVNHILSAMLEAVAKILHRPWNRLERCTLAFKFADRPIHSLT